MSHPPLIPLPLSIPAGFDRRLRSLRVEHDKSSRAYEKHIADMEAELAGFKDRPKTYDRTALAEARERIRYGLY